MTIKLKLKFNFRIDTIDRIKTEKSVTIKLKLKFLSSRLPENGVFDDKTVHNFRRKLLRSELSKAHEAKLNSTTKTDEIRRLLADACGVLFLHSVVFYTRQFMRDVTRKNEAHARNEDSNFI